MIAMRSGINWIRQLIATIVPPCSIDMFVKKFVTRSIFVAKPQDVARFAVPVLLLAVMALLLWSSYVCLSIKNYKKIKSNFSTENQQNSTNKSSSKFQQSLGGIIGRRMTNYCQIQTCDAVSCSNIPYDSGTVVSNFIENKFKVDCKLAKSVKLSLVGCEFPENTLRWNWLGTNLSIEELTFTSCSLGKIDDDAFSLPIYTRTRTITMVKNRLTTLRKATFRHLKALQALNIRENVIESAEFNLLEEAAGSLTTLDLTQAINDREVLRNITGGTALLSSVEILRLSGNDLFAIDAGLFAGVPNVRSLYLDHSNIKTVSPDTLKPMASSIEQLMLYDNDIAWLPEGLLDSVNKPNVFRMFVRNNSWHCDCNLKWLKDFVESQSNAEYLICKTPKENANKSFFQADFCPRPTTALESTDHWTTSTQQVQSSEQTTETDGTVHVICNHAEPYAHTFNTRKLLSTELQFASRFPDFYVSEILDHSIQVSLPDFSEGLTLLWFDNRNVIGSLGCAKNARRSYRLRDIDQQATYTICLLDDNRDTVSPLNCLAVTTKSTYESGTWLTNADKSLVFLALTLSLILLFLVGGILSFLMIRRHPTLLRGSKRVMFVKRRNVDAIVLPKGVDIDEGKQREGKSHEDDYVTPLPPKRMLATGTSRLSRRSSQSDRNSYISQMETTESQLALWARLKCEQEKRKSIAPPLPPHPSDSIPSVSQTIDTKNDRVYEADAY
ncbi:leucine-rich repeat transmembrane protein FLRT1-like [Frieseomelitta varia]|uniref:leucine-rich repeat transmembrane protein FLRT1-like n=1 Tax=Frieseomelitta varia TaxID=561572 RepID=UPI001CB68473|nr:leucine-rich repeat transmembrane protein FLRT1-like [Frieseomelitta varia]